MERIDKIINHPLFTANLAIINECEADRKFCRHGMSHLLDVARIGCMILTQYRIDAGIMPDNVIDEQIYAAALLHDLGRAGQYKFGTPHEEAGAEIAREILRDCGYTSDEISEITEAVLQHRNEHRKTQKGSLAAILYEADKASRCCFQCEAWDECKWSYENKNKTVIY